MEALLASLVPRMLGDVVTFRLHNFGGKQSLLRKLEARLRGYSAWIPEEHNIIIVLDRDGDDCMELKASICSTIEAAGLSHKSNVMSGSTFQCAVRLAIEELEAWIFGDCDALRAAYPRIPVSLEDRAAYRDPDAIVGGTCEHLERVLQRAGYFAGGIPKIEVAATIAPHMDIWKNRSQSFKVFRDLLEAL